MPSTFFEVEFPRTVGYKATGGPMFNTTVNPGFNGFEQRNRNWARVRAKWTVDLLTPPPSQFNGTPQQFIDMVHSFFLVVGGKADGFRFFDHKDNAAVGQALSPVADGVNKLFQLTKTYSIGGRTYTRTITKPIQATVNNYKGVALTNTVKVYVGGVLKTLTTDYTIDVTTGIITFVTAPPNLSVISADFQFHYPVRFDTDEFPMQIEDSDVNGGKTIISSGSLPLIEVR
jgi:uncharacterized protein (TIGR02217 family)